MKFLLTILLCVCAATIHAQTDYIVTAKGDTLKGDVKGRYTSAKLTMGGKKLKYQADSVKGYYSLLDNAFYASKMLPNNSNSTFVKVLETGNIRLYEYYRVTSGGYPTPQTYVYQNWYIDKDNEPLAEVKTNSIFGSRKERKGAFFNMIADNKNLSDRFAAEESYDFKLVRKYVQEYNIWSAQKH